MDSAEATSEEPFKGIIFDLDGTLLDTLADLAEAMNQVLRKQRLPTHPVDAYRYFVGDGVEALVRRALPPDTNEQFIERCTEEFRKRYSATCYSTTAPYEGISEMLDELANCRLFLAVLSNKPHHATVDMVRHYFPERHFIACIGNGMFPKKPDPSAVRYILSQMGMSARNCLYVGDSATDMKTATAAGCRSAGVLWGFRDERELRENGAGWIVRHPSEIVNIVTAGVAVA